MLRRQHAAKGTRVLNELGLIHGACRADIAVVNGRLIGYEIKSDEDTLARLKSQVAAYNSIFDNVTIIVGRRHEVAIPKHVPKWWGIVISREGERGAVHFEVRRRAVANPGVDPLSVAQLLWRDEVIEALRMHGVEPKRLRAPRRRLYRQLSRALPLDDLRGVVRAALKGRSSWRCRPRPCVYGGSSLPTAKL